MTVEAIRCEKLGRVYATGKTVALDGIDLVVPRGCVFGLLGPNGAGKTTTIRILSTLLTPTSGSARVMGLNVMEDTAGIRSRIGLILGGDRGLYGRLTGRENLEYFAALNRIPSGVASRRIEELCKTVGLYERRNDPVEEYSRGMKQRLHIARGLLNDPEVIFMDEPTIGLDPAVARDIRAIVPGLASQGKTVLLTTHYMVEADLLCDQIALINHGRIIAGGTPAVIKQRVSRLNVIELRLREVLPESIEALEKLPGIKQVQRLQEGVLQKLVVQGISDEQFRSRVLGVLDDGLVESVLEREPTLEEAYLHILV